MRYVLLSPCIGEPLTRATRALSGRDDQFQGADATTFGGRSRPHPFMDSIVFICRRSFRVGRLAVGIAVGWIR